MGCGNFPSTNPPIYPPPSGSLLKWITPGDDGWASLGGQGVRNNSGRVRCVPANRAPKGANPDKIFNARDLPRLCPPHTGPARVEPRPGGEPRTETIRGIVSDANGAAPDMDLESRAICRPYVPPPPAPSRKLSRILRTLASTTGMSARNPSAPRMPNSSKSWRR